MSPPDDVSPLDCLIIGGGPGGLVAALYLGRFQRRVLAVDAGFSRADWIPLSHNMPAFPEGLPGPELLARLRRQARTYDAELRDGRIDALRLGDEGFVAETGGARIRARTVILATGVEEVVAPFEGLAEAARAGRVRVCPICDGYECRGRSVGVIGPGAHAAREAIYLSNWADRVSLLLSGEPEGIDQELSETLAARGVTIEPVSPADLSFTGDGGRLTIRGEDDTGIDLVYTAFGTRPRSALAAGLGAVLAEDRRLIVDAHQETSVPGFYAVGDVVRGLNQISVASGEAAIAATAIHNRLPPRGRP